eukprot:1163263-Amphidinium_carterae.1
MVCAWQKGGSTAAGQWLWSENWKGQLVLRHGCLCLPAWTNELASQLAKRANSIATGCQILAFDLPSVQNLHDWSRPSGSASLRYGLGLWRVLVGELCDAGPLHRCNEGLW